MQCRSVTHPLSYTYQQEASYALCHTHNNFKSVLSDQKKESVIAARLPIGPRTFRGRFDVDEVPNRFADDCTGFFRFRLDSTVVRDHSSDEDILESPKF